MILNLYKPRGLTSHDVVDRVRRITGERRVGHGGTLDPQAEGVLIVGVGRDSTRNLEETLKGTDKEYIATIVFGKTSATDDSEGEVTPTKAKLKGLTRIKLIGALRKFTGTIEQVPPVYSAVKISGRPAYKLAREGKEVALKKRSVTVKRAGLISFNSPVAKVRFTVSSGTYIRSLARDTGKYLGAGGYLKELVRTRVGRFKLGDSISIEDLEKFTSA